jgi:hypothetical protein
MAKARASSASEKRVRACPAGCARRTVLLRIGWNAFGGLNDFTSRGHKIIQTCAGDDYRVASAMRFFRDSHEAAPLVLSEFYEEMFTLDL